MNYYRIDTTTEINSKQLSSTSVPERVTLMPTNITRLPNDTIKTNKKYYT